jgi:hypothetical protein
MRVRTIAELLPTFAEELERLTAAAGRPDLVPQIRTLPVFDRCRCGEGNCAHFYTEPKPRGSYGDGHSNVTLPAEQGMIVYDLVDGRIVAVEVLDRLDVKATIDEYFGAAG